MATIILTVPNPVATRVTDAICTKFGYSATLPDGSANPQTKSDFVKSWLIKQLKEAVREHEANTAAATAAINAQTDVDNNINIT